MNPITRRLLRQADEAEAGSPYPAKPARCAYRLVRFVTNDSRYVGQCLRSARASGLCWQHERIAVASQARDSAEQITNPAYDAFWD